MAGVRTEQTKVREELVANQNEMRTDFSEKHAENKRGSRSIRRSWSNSGDGAGRPEALQPSRVQRLREQGRGRSSTLAPAKLYRTSEPHHADVHAPIYSAYQCILQEDRKPRRNRRASRDVLQLLPNSSNASHHPRDGCRVLVRRFGKFLIWFVSYNASIRQRQLIWNLSGTESLKKGGQCP